ncbi:hypothetical protein F0U60_12665 [Archangium minus]|uniref:Uncharacterized protein n=1 Tax=Archangium minus TaxID=83450 RepID=A0ABY9WM22_9BACT|nr:hypothetical protein F0U60_12665 [Archangium minus]
MSDGTEAGTRMVGDIAPGGEHQRSPRVRAQRQQRVLQRERQHSRR